MTRSTVTLPTVPGETPADRIIRIVRSYIGCSLTDRRDDLGELIARGVDTPAKVVTIATNCATSALGIMALAGVDDDQLCKPYVSGMAVSWVRLIGKNTGALTKYTGPDGPQPVVGSLMRYNTPGTNNDHVEWLMSPIDEQGNADHAGGGRPNNLISMKHGNVFMSAGRPLQEFWDPNKLGIEFVPTLEPITEPNQVERESSVLTVTTNTSFWNTITSMISSFKGRR